MMSAMGMYHNAVKQKARYHARKNAGQCVRCDQPASPGRSMCEAHRARIAAYNADRYRLMADALKKIEGRAD